MTCPRQRACVFGVLALAVCLAPPSLRGQAVAFESGGLTYQTLTHEGLTIMFAPLPSRIRDYFVLQIAVLNGSETVRTIKAEDFRYLAADGFQLQATPARSVVEEFLRRGGRNDVIQLVSTYELSLYGLSRFQSTSGYEVRRRHAMAEQTSVKLKAATTAAAIVLVPTKLKPGQSTDGAIFFALQNREFGPGRLVATPDSTYFDFEVGGLRHPGELMRRP
jgi:hypothetical protein